MLLEHHFRVGRHLKRINDGTCSSPNYMSLRISRNGDRSLVHELHFQLSRSRSGGRGRGRNDSRAIQRDCVAGRVEREAETSPLSRFPPRPNEIPSRGPSPAKNLVPSPRNDNRMDGCALDLHRVSRSRKFPPSKRRRCFFPSSFQSSFSWISFRTCFFVDRRIEKEEGPGWRPSEERERESRRRDVFETILLLALSGAVNSLNS